MSDKFRPEIHPDLHSRIIDARVEGQVGASTNTAFVNDAVRRRLEELGY